MVIGHWILHFDFANSIFILSATAGFLLLLMEFRLPESVTYVGEKITGMLLCIYLLHPYLRLSFSSILPINLIASFIMVLVVSKVIESFSTLIGRQISVVQLVKTA